MQNEAKRLKVTTFVIAQLDVRFDREKSKFAVAILRFFSIQKATLKRIPSHF